MHSTGLLIMFTNCAFNTRFETFSNQPLWELHEIVKK